MDGANSVSFKVFLTKEGSDGKQEIRRFGIDRDVVSSFTYLKEKLQAVFPSLTGNIFTISWKDVEGDEVLISSDEELIVALTEMQTSAALNEVCKLYVELKDSSARKDDGDSPDKEAVHVGVCCDGCNDKVEGFRYKCIQCRDYDLCAVCEAKGLHSEHCMIRLPTPSYRRPYFGRRLLHHLGKSARRGAQEGEKQCPYEQRKKHHHGESNGCQGQGFFEILSSYLNEFVKVEDTPQDKDKKCRGRKSTEDENVAYLKNVGQTVANLLDPLGISVDVEVRTDKDDTKDTNKASPETDKTQQSQKPNRDESGIAASSVPKEPKSERESPEKEGWTVVNSADAASAVGATAAVNDNPINTVTSSTQDITSGRGNGAAYHISGAVPKQSAAEAGVPAAQSSSRNHNQIGFMPNIATTPNAQPGWQAGAAGDQLYPNLSLHRNPHIASAIEKMMAMGFSNQGGWLTQLLEGLDGNIDKALDVLAPVKKL